SIKRRPFRSLENKLLRPGACGPSPMTFKLVAKCGADRDYAMTASRFRRPELSTRIVLRNFNPAAEQINALPSQRQDFANAHPGKNSDRDDGTAWLGQHPEQQTQFRRLIVSPLFLRIRFAKPDTVSGIFSQVFASYGGFQHRRERCSNTAQRRGCMALLLQPRQTRFDVRTVDIA